MAQYVKVIQKNKGAFKNFLKKIEQIQDYKATCGIHKDVGRLKVKHRNIKKSKETGSFRVKDSSKSVVEGKKRSSSSRKSALNLATLSDILERRISWTQKNKALFTPANDGDNKAIGGSSDPDKKYVKPARIFIHLEKVSNAWTDVQNIAQSECMMYLTKLETSRGKRVGQNLFKEIADKVSERQRQRITNKETLTNAQLTIDIKGFDWPLFDSGLLLRSIQGRVVRNSTGKKVRCAYIATNMDEMIRKINSSARG